MMGQERILRVAAWALLLPPAAVFHAGGHSIRLAGEGRGSLFTDFWMTQALLAIGAWVYVVPVLAAGLLWLTRVPGSERSATPTVLFVYYVVASALWAIAAMGTLEPIFNPEAAI